VLYIGIDRFLSYPIVESFFPVNPIEIYFSWRQSAGIFPESFLQIFGKIENLLPFAALERAFSSPISFALYISVPSRLFFRSSIIFLALESCFQIIVAGFSGEAYFRELSENGLLSPLQTMSGSCSLI
jgi:hypothetical protein